MKLSLNLQSHITHINIEKAENYLKGMWIGDFEVLDKGKSTNILGSYFYVPKPKKEHSHVPVFYFQEQRLYIRDGINLFSKDWVVSIGKSGEVIKSRYRHDYVLTRDKTAMIDGGFDYAKSYGNTVELQVCPKKLFEKIYSQKENEITPHELGQNLNMDHISDVELSIKETETNHSKLLRMKKTKKLFHELTA